MRGTSVGIVATLLLGMTVPGTVRAQEPVTAPVTPAKETPSAQTPTAEDLALLKKAIEGVRKSTGVGIVSEIDFVAQASGVNLTLKSNLSIVAKFPNRFVSKVTILKPDGTPDAKYDVIGDGTKVWTSRPGISQYSVESVKEFEAGSPFLVKGVLGGLVASGEGGPTGDLSDLEKLKSVGATLTVATAPSESGPTIKVFTMSGATNKNAGFGITMSINAATATFTRVVLRGPMDDGSVVMTETIREYSPSPAIVAGTFTFTPPAKAKKVEKVKLGPF